MNKKYIKNLTKTLSNKKNNKPSKKTAPKRLKKEPILCLYADDHEINNLANRKEVENNAHVDKQEILHGTMQILRT